MRNDKTIKIKKVDPRNLPDTLRDPEGIRDGYIDQDEIEYTIPGLGSPNAPESSSVYSFRLSRSGALPVLEHIVKTGLRVGEWKGSSVRGNRMPSRSCRAILSQRQQRHYPILTARFRTASNQPSVLDG
jgi:hypothetical protein